MLERPATFTSVALPSSCSENWSLFEFQLDGRHVFFSACAKELLNISLDVNECRHKQVASLWQNNQWHKYRIRNSEAEMLQKKLKLNRSYQCKAVLEKENKLMDSLKRSTDDQARQTSVCWWGFNWNIVSTSGPQHSREMLANKSYLQREVRLVQDLERTEGVQSRDEKA